MCRMAETTDSGTRARHPSTTHPTAAPCDSPYVATLNHSPNVLPDTVNILSIDFIRQGSPAAQSAKCRGSSAEPDVVVEGTPEGFFEAEGDVVLVVALAELGGGGAVEEGTHVARDPRDVEPVRGRLGERSKPRPGPGFWPICWLAGKTGFFQ